MLELYSDLPATESDIVRNVLARRAHASAVAAYSHIAGF